MTHRNSYGSSYGRGSPYNNPPRLGQQDRSISDMFEYVDPDDASLRSSSVVEDDNAPDVLSVRYLGQPFRLTFPPYSISENGVKVQDVRNKIADLLQKDPRRVRLVYKDQELKYDPDPVRKYGCKQNSEIMVVVTEQLIDYGKSEYYHSSGDDSGYGSSLRLPTGRPRAASSVRYRSNDEIRTVASSGSRLQIPGHNGTSHHDSHHTRRRSPSPARRTEPAGRSSDRSSATPQPSPTPISRTAPADPNSPMGKVQALQHLYYDQWYPECQKYLKSPPSDPTQREKEYRRLSESVMKHIVEAADAIELEGDQNARAARKQVIGDATTLLKQLDDVGKAK